MLLSATKERGKTLVELAEQIKLITDAPKSYDEKAAKKAFKGEAKEILNAFADMLVLASPTTKEAFHSVMELIVAEKGIGFGKIGMPLRVALMGSMTGSGMDEIMAILGVSETIARIEKAISTIELKVKSCYSFSKTTSKTSWISNPSHNRYVPDSK
jgi:glutamyl-tRNA synthetase